MLSPYRRSPAGPERAPRHEDPLYRKAVQVEHEAWKLKEKYEGLHAVFIALNNLGIQETSERSRIAKIIKQRWAEMGTHDASGKIKKEKPWWEKHLADAARHQKQQPTDTWAVTEDTE